MKRLIAPALLALMLAGPAFAETRNIRRFHALDIEGQVTVTLEIGETRSVDVTGADADHVRTLVRDGVLKIENTRGGDSPLDVQVRIVAPEIDSLALSEGAQLTADFTGGCDDLSVVALRGATATLTGMQCDSVSSRASMGGRVSMVGSCRRHTANASMGASFVRAEELVCERVDASASMGAHVNAFASQTYEANATMGGQISVAGGGTSSDTNSSMGGAVHTP